MNVLGKMYVGLRDTVRPEVKTRSKEIENAFLASLRAGSLPPVDQMLDKVLRYAATTIPYYRKCMQTNDGTIRPLEEWPVLTKEIIRSNYGDLKAPDLASRVHWESASGGSTGKPVHVVHDEEFAAIAEATRKYAAEVFYGGPYLNKIIFWGAFQEAGHSDGNESFKQKMKASVLQAMGLRTTTFNTFYMSEAKLGECAKQINSQKPDFILGYAGSVYQVAKYFKKNGIKVAKPPKAIQLTAQTLYPFMREVITEVFQCQICNHYGSREVGPATWEGPDGKMYICDFFDVIEVVDEQNRPVQPGEEGKVLVTTLHNFAMPLIRYDIGDRAIKGAPSTLGGYTFPTLEQIVGKNSEEFVSKQGNLIHGQFFINLFYFRNWIDEFQVVQTDYEKVDINFVRRAETNPSDVLDIEGKIRSVLGVNCQVNWNEMSEIPKTPAGKHLYIRSLVKAPSAGDSGSEQPLADLVNSQTDALRTPPASRDAT